MKNVISLVVLVAALFLFTGCGKAINYPVVNHIKDSKIVEIEVDESFAPKVQRINQYRDLSEIGLYDAIKKAAEYSLSEGYSHFSILNGGINNLQGFPITNYADLRQYCFGYKMNSLLYSSQSYAKCDKISNKGRSRVTLVVIPLNESNEIFSWNAKEVLAELK